MAMQLEEYFDFLRPDDIRLRGTRVGIETILYDHLKRDRRPDEIQESYPSLTLEQVYATILYFLHNMDQVQTYLDDWLEHGRRMQEEQRKNPSSGLARVEKILRERRDAAKSAG
jgi:uncharacterized protein (DUF433 family)